MTRTAPERGPAGSPLIGLVLANMTRTVPLWRLFQDIFAWPVGSIAIDWKSPSWRPVVQLMPPVQVEAVRA